MSPIEPPTAMESLLVDLAVGGGQRRDSPCVHGAPCFFTGCTSFGSSLLMLRPSTAGGGGTPELMIPPTPLPHM